MRVRDITPEWCELHLEGWEYDARTKKGKAWCPVHPDEGTSMKGLAVSFVADKPLLKCHSPECGANGSKVLRACENGTVQMDVAYRAVSRSTLGKIVEVYSYTDEYSAVLYRIARYDPKNFRPVSARRKVVSFSGRPVPYNLPLLLRATEPWIVDGERMRTALRTGDS